MTPCTVLFVDGPQAGLVVEGVSERTVGFVDPTTREQGVYHVHLYGVMGHIVYLASVRSVAEGIDQGLLWDLLYSDKAKQASVVRERNPSG